MITLKKEGMIIGLGMLLFEMLLISFYLMPFEMPTFKTFDLELFNKAIIFVIIILFNFTALYLVYSGVKKNGK